MKVTTSTIYRLAVEKDCGCISLREYGDPQYKTPLCDHEFSACEKHKAKPDVAEILGELLNELVDKEAEQLGKTVVKVQQASSVARVLEKQQQLQTAKPIAEGAEETTAVATVNVEQPSTAARANDPQDPNLVKRQAFVEAKLGGAGNARNRPVTFKHPVPPAQRTGAPARPLVRPGTVAMPAARPGPVEEFLGEDPEDES